RQWRLDSGPGHRADSPASAVQARLGGAAGTRGRPDGFDLVRKSVGVPLCIDQGAHNNPLAYEAIVRSLADFLCTDVHRMGGVLQTKEIASMARLVNIDVCRHASAEYGISATAHLHLAATIPNLTIGNQTYRTMIADDIVNEPTGDFQNGCLKIP